MTKNFEFSAASAATPRLCVKLFDPETAILLRGWPDIFTRRDGVGYNLHFAAGWNPRERLPAPTRCAEESG